MLRLLFWNVNRKDLSSEIRVLATEHQIDILILAEDPVSTGTRLSSLNKELSNYYITPSVCERLNIFTSFGDALIKLKRESKYFTIREISLPTHQSFLLCALHWKSLRNRSPSSQNSALIQLAHVIREEEDMCGHRRTIAVGDFNSEPYSDGMTAANGMHAVMCRNVASRGEREVSPFGDFPFFYNPTWSVYGDDRESPPGSYYYRSSEDNCQFWHLFDQVLVRPQLLPFLPKDSTHVLTKAGSSSLISERGIPTSSDHLPILLNFDLPTK